MEMFDLKRQQERLRNRIDERIRKVLDHGMYILGPEVKQLEEALARYVEVPYCLTCSSGADALLIALMAWEIGPGDAAFVPAFSFVATAEAVSRVGATPVFVDVDARTFTIDLASVEDAFARTVKKNLRPRVVVPVNLFGQMADYTALSTFAKKNELLILEDAAQSFGARWNAAAACSLGDLGCTSFYPAKPLGCYGDGGAVFCSDRAVFEKLKSIRVHGQGTSQYLHQRIGMTGRLDTLQAAILIEKLAVFDDEIKLRNQVAEYYSERLKASFQIPQIAQCSSSVWAQYSLLHDQRDRILDVLQQRLIATRVYYPVPLHLQEVYRYLGYRPGDLPNSEQVARRIFSIPMHPYLERVEQDQVIEALLSVT